MTILDATEVADSDWEEESSHEWLPADPTSTTTMVQADVVIAVGPRRLPSGKRKR